MAIGDRTARHRKSEMRAGIVEADDRAAIAHKK